jgi:hypothetical protein
MISNVVALVETKIEYGVKHLGRNMLATTVTTMSQGCLLEALQDVAIINGGVKGLREPNGEPTFV